MSAHNYQKGLLLAKLANLLVGSIKLFSLDTWSIINLFASSRLIVSSEVVSECASFLWLTARLGLRDRIFVNLASALAGDFVWARQVNESMFARRTRMTWSISGCAGPIILLMLVINHLQSRIGIVVCFSCIVLTVFNSKMPEVIPCYFLLCP